MSSQDSDVDRVLEPGSRTRRQRLLAGEPVEENIPLPSRTNSRRRSASAASIASIDSAASGTSADSALSKQARRRVDSVRSLEWDSAEETITPQFNDSTNFNLLEQNPFVDSEDDVEQEVADLDATTTAFGTPDTSAETFIEAMARNEELIMSNRLVLIDVGQMIADDIETCNLKMVPPEFLTKRADEADQAKAQLRAAAGYLFLNDKDEYKANWEPKVVTYRAALVNFVKQAQERLYWLSNKPADTATARNPTEAAQMASRKIKAASVNNYCATVTADMEALSTQLKEFKIDPNTDQADFRRQEEVEKIVAKRVEVLRTDAQRMRADAVEAGMAWEAGEVEKKLRALQKDYQKVAETMLNERKSRNLLSSTSASAVFRSSDISPPTFSGDPSDKTDYYRFAKELKQYADIKNPSTEELFRVLLTKCLKGEALSSTEHLKTKDEVMKYLQDTYGNVRLLINAQVGEIKKMGSCQGNELKMRTWALAISSKMAYVQALANDHDLQVELYHSRIGPEIQSRLSTKLQDEFLLELEKLEQGQDLGKERVFKELMLFIEKLARRFTYRLKFDTQLSEEHQTSKPTRDKPPERVQQGKQPPKRSYTVEEVPREKKKGNRKDRKADAVKAGDGNGGVADGGRPVRKYNNVQLTEVDCRLCKKEKHIYLYYCQSFIDADPQDRFNLTWDAGTCFRCMALNPHKPGDERKAWYSGHTRNCDKKWVCESSKCGDKLRKMHFLLCLFHVEENKDMLKEFMKTLDKNKVDSSVKFFFNIPVMLNWCMSAGPAKSLPGWETLPDPCLPSIFMLSYALIEGNEYLIFFDSGCMTASISEEAARKLSTQNVREGPTQISVASGEILTIPGGEERFSIPLSEGSLRCTITALEMPEVTTPFPLWPLTEAKKELESNYKAWYPHGADLPKTPDKIGGARVDIMLGIRYFRFFPQVRYMMETGLSMYQSLFVSPNGEDGVLAGPHRSWKNINGGSHLLNRVHQVRVADTVGAVHQVEHIEELDSVDVHGDVVNKAGLQVEYDPNSEFSSQCDHELCDAHQQAVQGNYNIDTNIYSNLTKEMLARFVEGEDIGSIAEYRCPSCRSCLKCKHSDVLESRSFAEEREQHLIEKSLFYDRDQRQLYARLPFIANPREHLKPNLHIAKRVFESQMKKAMSDDNIRLGIVASHKKLFDRGFVCRVADLPPDVRQRVEGEVGYTIPWRTVVKESSLSTPVRLVFDASSKTPGGDSLNQVLAKGSNSLGNLFSLLMKFRLKSSGFCADVSMAYNGIRLASEHISFQKFLWKEGMWDISPLEIWVVLTLIYGIKSAGQQTIAGFGFLGAEAVGIEAFKALGTKEFEEKLKALQNLDVLDKTETVGVPESDTVGEPEKETVGEPKSVTVGAPYVKTVGEPSSRALVTKAVGEPKPLLGAEVLKNKAYMDDLLSAHDSMKEAMKAANELKSVLALGSMSVKEVTFSGQPPTDVVSSDGKHVGLLGYEWASEDDLIRVNIGELYLGKKNRGKTPETIIDNLEEKLSGKFTRRIIVGKVAGVFDPLGLLVPVTAKYKLQLSDICRLKLGWDDPIPPSFLKQWVANIYEMQDLNSIYFARSVIPADAASPKISYIASCDSSKEICIAVIHSRVKKRDGTFFVQVLAAKSKIVTNLTIPRAELKGAVVSSSLAHCARMNTLSFNIFM